MKDGHVKDAAQQEAAQDVAEDVVEDVAGDVAGDVLGAAEDGGMEVLSLPILISKRRNPRPTHACRPPHLPLGDT